MITRISELAKISQRGSWNRLNSFLVKRGSVSLCNLTCKLRMTAPAVRHVRQAIVQTSSEKSKNIAIIIADHLLATATVKMDPLNR